VTWQPTAHTVAWDAGLRIEMVGRTLWFYTRAFLFPIPDTLHQSTLGPWDTPQLLTALLGFFAAGIWVAVHLHVWPNRPQRVLVLWTTLTLLPCLNIVPIPSQFVACYRAAIPLLGVAGLAGMMLGRDEKPEEAPWRLVVRRLVAPGMLASVWIGLSLADVPAWQGDLAIEQAEYHADPNFLPALGGYAGTLQRAGRFREALSAYNRVVARLFPASDSVEDRIARSRSPEMLRAVKSQSSLRYQPREFLNLIFRGRGGTEQMLGMWDAAVDDYRVALALQPDDADVADALANAYWITGRVDDARILQEKIAARAPSGPHLLRLGTIYYHQSRWTDARNCWTKALELTPSTEKDQRQELLQLLQQASLRATQPSQYGH
jgi:tetratricopeptide (TPR) repeat protein